jgi:chitodextrinase
VGAPVAIAIEAVDVTDLAAAQISLTYNPTILRFDSVTEGAFLDDGSNAAQLLSTTDETTSGAVRNIIITRIGGGGVSGSGTIATARFTTLAPGAVTIGFSEMLLAASDGSAIADTKVSATLNVQAPADATPPSKPTNLAASSVTSTSLALTWNAATDNTGVTAYRVYQGATKLKEVSAPATTITGLSASTTYQFSVSAVDAAGNEGAKSTSVTVQTNAPPVVPDTTPPTTPSSLAASAVTSSQLTLTWNAATDNKAVTGYNVWQGTSKVKTVATTSATITGLSASTAYQFSVSAFDAAGNEGTKSSSISVTTAAPPVVPDTTAPGAPSNVHTTSVTATSIALAWDTVTDPSGIAAYKVWIDGTTTPVTTSEPVAILSTLQPETLYRITVSAVDGAENEGARSEQITVTTTAEASDEEAPSIRIVTPAPSSVVKNTITISTSITNQSPVTQVVFSANGNELEVDSDAPFQTTWDTSRVSDGEYKLMAALTTASNLRANDSVTVVVKNQEEAPSRGGGGGGGGGGSSSSAYTNPYVQTTTGSSSSSSAGTGTKPIVPQRKLVSVSGSASGSLDVSYTGTQDAEFTLVRAPASRTFTSTDAIAVYDTYELSATGVSLSDIDGTTVTLRVPKTWLTQNSVAIDDVAIYGYESSGWRPLSSSVAQESDDAYFITTASTDIVTFALAGERGESDSESESAATAVPYAPQEEAPAQGRASFSFSPSLLLVFGITLVFIIGGASMLVYRRTHKAPRAELTLGTVEKTKPSLKPSMPAAALSPMDAYVRDLRAKGISDEAIREELRNADWPERVIEEYFNSHPRQ